MQRRVSSVNSNHVSICRGLPHLWTQSCCLHALRTCAKLPYRILDFIVAFDSSVKIACIKL